MQDTRPQRDFDPALPRSVPCLLGNGAPLGTVMSATDHNLIASDHGSFRQYLT
jgi:hypothetical protein